jgi:hypothetical protein
MEISRKLREEGRLVYGYLWRDDGLGINWYLEGSDTRLVPDHQDYDEGFARSKEGGGKGKKHRTSNGNANGNGSGNGEVVAAPREGSGKGKNKAIPDGGVEIPQNQAKKVRREAESNDTSSPSMEASKVSFKPNKPSTIAARSSHALPTRPSISDSSNTAPSPATPGPAQKASNTRPQSDAATSITIPDSPPTAPTIENDIPSVPPASTKRNTTKQTTPAPAPRGTRPSTPDSPPEKLITKTISPPPTPASTSHSDPRPDPDVTALNELYQELHDKLIELDRWTNLSIGSPEMQAVLDGQIQRKEREVFAVDERIKLLRKKIAEHAK